MSEIFCTCCAALCAASLRDFPARRFGGQPPPPRVRNKVKGLKKTPLFWSILSLYPLLLYIYMSIRLYTEIREFQDLTVERP